IMIASGASCARHMALAAFAAAAGPLAIWLMARLEAVDGSSRKPRESPKDRRPAKFFAVRPVLIASRVRRCHGLNHASRQVETVRSYSRAAPSISLERTTGIEGC